jgi:hypothetical protein
LVPEIQLGDTIAQCAREFFMDDPDEDLPGCQAAQHIGAQCPLTDQSHEIADYRQGNVGLDKGAPDVANGILDIVVGESATATDLIENTPQAITQRIEH